MKPIFLFLSCFSIITPCAALIDADNWFAVYDDEYITSVEILGHMYVVRIIQHDVNCKACSIGKM